MGYRDQGHAQLAGRDRDLAGAADVTATRVASSKTTTAQRAERQFRAVGTVTQRTGTGDQNGGYARGCRRMVDHALRSASEPEA